MQRFRDEGLKAQDRGMWGFGFRVMLQDFFQLSFHDQLFSGTWEIGAGLLRTSSADS